MQPNKQITLVIVFIAIIHFAFSQKNARLFDGAYVDSTLILNAKSLFPFFRQLNTRDKEAVRILHWGDSHIQMGHMSGKIKGDIDSLYGGNGYGNIFPYKIAKYNPFYSYTKVKTGKWFGGNIMQDSMLSHSGYSGFWVGTTDSVASVQMGIANSVVSRGENYHVKFFYQGNDHIQINITGSNMSKDSSQIYSPISVSRNASSDSLKTWKTIDLIFDKPIDALQVTIQNNIPASGFYIHGAIFEKTQTKGVSYLSCGIGGAQFKHLIYNSTLPIQEARHLNTKLFIISFGSNESYMSTFDYTIYKNTVKDFIIQLRKEIPGVSILMTGPPDTRSKNRFPRNTGNICKIFEELSTELDFAYWDLRKAMGGEGSIFNWLNNGMASSDKLHFTQKGYYLQGKWLTQALHREFEKFNLQVTK